MRAYIELLRVIRSLRVLRDLKSPTPMPTIHYPPPAFTLADAVRIAQTNFGIDGVVTSSCCALTRYPELGN